MVAQVQSDCKATSSRRTHSSSEPNLLAFEGKGEHGRVADFVPNHRLDHGHVPVQVLDQRVIHNDALRTEHPGDVGVGVLALL